MKTAKAPETSQKTSYVSNPFTLAFQALGRFFNTNTNWAVVAICVGTLSFLGRLDSSVPEAPATNGPLQANPLLHHPDISVIVATIIVIVVSVLAGVIVLTVLQVFVQGMYIYTALQSEKGKSITPKKAFQATRQRFWRLFSAQLLAYAKIIGWTCLLIIPGIIASLRYTLLGYVIMDEPADKTGVTTAHTRTKELTKGRLIEVLGIAFASGIVPIIGLLANITGNAALYRQLQIYHDKKLEKPPVHWLNYLGIAIVIILITGVIILTAITLRNPLNQTVL